MRRAEFTHFHVAMWSDFEYSFLIDTQLNFSFLIAFGQPVGNLWCVGSRKTPVGLVGSMFGSTVCYSRLTDVASPPLHQLRFLRSYIPPSGQPQLLATTMHSKNVESRDWVSIGLPGHGHLVWGNYPETMRDGQLNNVCLRWTRMFILRTLYCTMNKILCLNWQ